MKARSVRICQRLHASLRLALMLAFLLSTGDNAHGAFEANTMTTPERGCSSPDATGLAEGSVSAMYHSRPGSGPGCVAGAYGYRPFGLAGVDLISARARLTLVEGTAGLNLFYSGLAAPGYGERIVSAGLAVSLGDLWIQPGLRWGEVSAPGGYGGSALMLDLLAYSYPAPRLRLSFDVSNALSSGLDIPGGDVPGRIAAGLGYAVLSSVACGLRVEKENGLRTALRTGIEWRAARVLFLRLGSCTYPRELSFGLGVCLSGLSLDLSSTVNLDLGMTHAAGITWHRE